MTRLLGPALLVPSQTKILADGADIIVPRDRVYPSAFARARVGDHLWVREPYVEIKGYVRHCDVHEFALGFGPLEWPKNMPAHLLPYSHKLKVRQHNGQRLGRCMSRAILTISERRRDSLLCTARMQTVAAFLGLEDRE